VALLGYLALDRRNPPPICLEHALHITMAIWVTLTSTWAQVPDAAWDKWDWAFKTLAFTAFVPFAIRSRVQIEAFAQTYVFSLAANFVPFGLKTLISGGGYGVNLGLVAGNSGLAEGGLLSTLCLMAVPLAIHLSTNSQLIPRLKILPLGYWAIAGLATTTAIGTYERSALLGLAVLGIYMWTRSRHKLAFGLVIACVAIVVVYFTAGSYLNRMSSIGAPTTDSSATVRLLVWKWTLGFVATHPAGGGFSTYIVDHVDLPATADEPPHTEFGRAFHSIYFEVLGEHGYPGIAIFLAIAISMFFRMRRIAKRARRHPELAWVASLADALQSGLAVFLTAGTFVGIAFQPMFWYFIAMGVSLNAYMWRVERQEAPVEVGWRAIAARNAGTNAAAPVQQGWRGRPAQAPLASAQTRRPV
jgi:putative inorganic carbon (hco3(-)) transporter